MHETNSDKDIVVNVIPLNASSDAADAQQQTSEPPAATVTPNDAEPPAPVFRTDNFALKGLLLLACFYTVFAARTLFVPLTMAVLLFFVLAPLVRYMKQKIGISSGLGAGILVLTLIALLSYAVYSMAIPASSWLENAPANLLKAESKIKALKGSFERMQEASGKVEELTQMSDKPKPTEVAVKNDAGVIGLFSKGTDYLEQLIIFIVMLYFLLASGDMFLRKIVRITPEKDDKIIAIELARKIESEIGHYLLTISVINSLLGTATAISMYLLGMPNPMLWGVMAGTLAFIPYLGATVSFLVLTIVSLVTFDTIGRALWVPAVFLVLDVAVEQFLNPIIIGKRMALNPVMVFAGLTLWGWMWGILGAIAAVPILVVVKIFCDHIDRYHDIGEFLGGETK